MKKTELVFILDKSGSMCGLESDTIGGYNSMLQKQKELKEECVISTILFNNNYTIIHDRMPLDSIKALSLKDYEVGGSTALLDAIGYSITKISNAYHNTLEKYRPNRVMFVIITDGLENASREYRVEKIREMIEYYKEEYNWEFIFLGANIDAIGTAKTYGINADRVANYVADSKGTRLNFEAMSTTIEEFRTKGNISEEGLNKIRENTKSSKK